MHMERIYQRWAHNGHSRQDSKEYNLAIKAQVRPHVIQMHPATDTWMSGDRFGEIIALGDKYATVKLFRSGRTIKVSPTNLTDI